MEQNELQYALEAALFAAGEPVGTDKLCAVLEADETQLLQAAEQLADDYDYQRRGIKLVRLEDKLQLCTRAEYAEPVRRLLETNRTASLSQSALEVLAIIAYQQPTTRVYVEQIRGVDSSYTVRSLCQKGLIRECGKLDAPGRPTLYCTTDDFLRSFGLSKITELPPFEEFSSDMMEQLSFATAEGQTSTVLKESSL